MPSLQTPKYNQFPYLLTLCQRRTQLSSKSCHNNLQKCTRFNPIINRSSSSSPLVCTLDQYQVHATFHSPIFFSPSLLPPPNLLVKKKKVNQENEELATPIVPASLNNHFKSSLVYKPSLHHHQSPIERSTKQEYHLTALPLSSTQSFSLIDQRRQCWLIGRCTNQGKYWSMRLQLKSSETRKTDAFQVHYGP